MQITKTRFQITKRKKCGDMGPYRFQISNRQITTWEMKCPLLVPAHTQRVINIPTDHIHTVTTAPSACIWHTLVIAAVTMAVAKGVTKCAPADLAPSKTALTKSDNKALGQILASGHGKRTLS